MNRYLDTSLLVAAFTRETKTSAVQTWLNRQLPRTLAISDWVITEFSAALSIKLRSGQITATLREDALALFAAMTAQSLLIIPVSTSHFRSAARLADQHAIGLRAADALHLGIASVERAMLCTQDVRLSKAAEACGIRSVLL